MLYWRIKMKKVIFTALASATILFGVTAEELVQQNGCMECHNIMGKKAAPAFKGVARKNIQWYGDKAHANIVASIKNGSTGKYPNFAGAQMPSYSHINQEDLDRIGEWILYQYNKQKMK